MSKLLKVIVNTLLLLAILSAGALVIPPFAGITTLVSDGMGNTNISRGAVTYAKKTDTSSVATGDKILVDDNSGKYIYTIQSLDTAAGTASVKNVISGDTTEAVEETEIVEEAAAEETAEEVTEETEETEETESAEPETVEEIEEFEETIEEPEEEPEPEPSEPIELAMPVYTAEELLQKAHAAGDDPKVIEDPATGITILDYSDIL